MIALSNTLLVMLGTSLLGAVAQALSAASRYCGTRSW